MRGRSFRQKSQPQATEKGEAEAESEIEQHPRRQRPRRQGFGIGYRIICRREHGGGVEPARRAGELLSAPRPLAPPGRPVLCLVAGADAPLAALAAAVEGGADWLQLRERGLSRHALLSWVDDATAVARAAAARRHGDLRVLVNRRVDVALAAEADGVHLGFDALAPGRARALLGPGRLLGVSAHAVDELATAAGADYAHLAPIFAPLSKPAERPPLGLGALAAARAAGVPLLAQGGIDAGNAGAAVAAGASGVAVTGAVLGAADPAAAARALRAALAAAAAGGAGGPPGGGAGGGPAPGGRRRRAPARGPAGRPPPRRRSRPPIRPAGPRPRPRRSQSSRSA